MMSEQVAEPHEATSGLCSQLVLTAPIVALFTKQWIAYFRNKSVCLCVYVLVCLLFYYCG